MDTAVVIVIFVCGLSLARIWLCESAAEPRAGGKMLNNLLTTWTVTGCRPLREGTLCVKGGVEWEVTCP